MNYATKNTSQGFKFVLTASAISMLIEWYNLHLFGALVAVFAINYFPHLSNNSAFLVSLAIFAVAMTCRPIGALIFGKIGDSLGRKNTYLITLVLMGGSTTAIGMLPTFEQSKEAAIFLLIIFRIIQGLAFGGEYGASTILTAEHASPERRGVFTGILQSLATISLAFAIYLNYVLITELGEQQFLFWGWRISFLISAILVIISYLLRRKIQEPPGFHNLRIHGRVSKNPIKEAFQNKENLKKIIAAIVGPLSGQAVLCFTAFFYSYYFISNSVGLSYIDSSQIFAAAVLCASPFSILFGYLSDKLGRVPIMLAGLGLSIVFFFPIYQYINYFAELILHSNHSGQITLYKLYLFGVLFIQCVFVTMVYGPTAAFLVDLFPMRIRFTSFSFAYHAANGLIGGTVPIIVMANKLSDSNKVDSYFNGLYYPFFVCVISFTVTLALFRSKVFEKQERD